MSQSEPKEPNETKQLAIELLLHHIQYGVSNNSPIATIEFAHKHNFAGILEEHFKVPIKCCDYCFWMDGFTGECVLEFENGTPYTEEERKRCPYPEAYRFGHSPLMDNHDVMRAGPTHEQACIDHAHWMKNARMFRLQFKGKYFGVKKDGQ